jgi:cysteine desulfurase
MKRYYFDHSATTKVRPEVADAMVKAMTETFGNPSSVHQFGRDARVLLEESREKVARVLNADPPEVYFTSGGTEADNLALIGCMNANRDRGDHLITTQYEHHAVLYTAQYLERNGFRVSYIKPDPTGMISPDDVRRAVTDKTVMISVMYVNNEVGTINPIEEIGRFARSRGILFHTDAVQSFGKLPVDVEELNVDLLSLSGHKIYGPKGIGALYVRRGVKINPRAFGGHHERELRPGTENLPGIVGLAEAARLCQSEMQRETRRLTALRDRMLQAILDRIPQARLNGHPVQRLPGLNNISFEGVEGEALLLSLDLKGIAASTGSACSSGQTTASHVLLSMNIPPEIAQSSIRFSMGHENDESSVDYLLEVLPEMVEKLRAMSFSDERLP